MVKQEALKITGIAKSRELVLEIWARIRTRCMLDPGHQVKRLYKMLVLVRGKTYLFRFPLSLQAKQTFGEAKNEARANKKQSSI